MTQDLDRVSANFTIDGAEAVVNFQGEGIEPQAYHIRITPMESIERRQESAGDREGYSWGIEGPPPGIANAVRLNMKKSAGSYLTPEGRRIFEEAQLDPTTIFLPAPDVLGVLSYITGNSARTLRDLLDDVDEFSANPEEDAALFTEAWQQAKARGYVVAEEGPEYTSNLLELPKNLPEGIAVRLNMKKALEIGGVEFPDTLKFKEETTSPLDVETNVQKLYKDAETFVVNYIWSGLREHGIIKPDDANVTQTDVDKVQFNSASSLINQLMQEGWFAYLELSYNVKLRTDPQLQQQIFNTIQNEIREGVV